MGVFDWASFVIGCVVTVFATLAFALSFSLMEGGKENREDRNIRKARDTERNVGNRITKVLYMRTVGGMFTVLSDHREWKNGYQITLKHHSKNWPRPLLIVADCSLPADRQLGVRTTDSDFKYYPANDEGVQGVLDRAVKYMDTLSI